MNKKLSIRLFFLFECLVFMVIYVFGTHGMQAILHEQKENKLLIEEISSLAEQLKVKQNRYGILQARSFYKEKIAREHLHMARPDEIVYYTS